MKVARTTTTGARIYNAPLSRREVGLLAGWERERRASVTLEDLRALVGTSVARDVASRLVAKKALERIGRGRYLVRPLRTLSRPATPSDVVRAAVLLKDEAYYLGGLWALTFHRLTSQQYVSVLDTFVARRHQSRRLGSARLVFHRVKATRLQYGSTTTELEGLPVRVSDPEMTLIDLLDFPVLAGNASEALRMVKSLVARADRAKLIRWAVRGARNSTCQRLGVLLERAGSTPSRLAELHRRVSKTKSMLSMDPGARRKGPFNRRWSVVENDR